MIAALGDMFETVDVYRWKLDWKQLSGYLLVGKSARWSRSCKSVEFIYLSDRCSCVRNFNWISKGKNIYTSGRNDSTSDPVFVQYLEWMNSPASNNQILLFIIFSFSPVQCSRIEASRCKPGKSNGLQLAEIVVVCNRIKSTREINSDAIELMLQERGKKSLAVIKLTSWWHDRDAV